MVGDADERIVLCRFDVSNRQLVEWDAVEYLLHRLGRR